MIGILLVLTSMFFFEIATSIGKTKVQAKEQSIYTMGFLTSLWGGIAFLLIALLIRQTFLFSFESLPTFIPRAVLEIGLAHLTVLAISNADRSTYGFVRTGTFPLLLIVDLIIGYTIGLPQVLGIAIILLTLIVLISQGGIRRKGIWFVILTTLLPVLTISLYKYNITYFNSVEAEQSIIVILLTIYFFIMAKIRAKENPLSFLTQPIYFLQSVFAGVGLVGVSFAFLFAAPSIIMTAKRASDVLWSILSGRVYFKEQKFGVKMIALVMILIGLAMMFI